MIRSSNTGPHHLICALFQGLPNVRSFRISAIVLVLLITTVLSQLSSTALLSDVVPGMILGNEESSSIAFGRNGSKPLVDDLLDTAFARGANYRQAKPPAYPIFAEYSEPPSEEPLVLDTGYTLRALLPFRSPSKRSVLRSYSGMATVADSRVTCTLPVLSANVTRPSGAGLASPLLLHGLAMIVNTPPMLKEKPRDTSRQPFTCSVPMASNSSYQRANLEWKTSLCELNSTYLPQMLGAWDDSDRNSEAFLILNSTGTEAEWEPILEAGFRWEVSMNGIWFEMLTPTPGVQISATLCSSISRSTTSE